MMRLYLFEWKKLFNKKVCILSFLALFLLNCCLISYPKYSELQNNQGLEKTYTYYGEQIVGTLGDAINRISQFNNDLEHKNIIPISGGIDVDQIILRQLSDEVQSLIAYEKEMQVFTEKTEQNIQYFNDRNELDKVAINEKLKSTYENRSFTNFSYIKGWIQLFKYQASSLLILLLLFIVIPPVWSSEREVEMDMQSELKKLFSQKVIIVLLAILCMSSVITLLNFKKINPFSQEDSHGYYQDYLSLYHGKLTDDKLSQIENEKALISDAEDQRVRIYDSLQQSKLYTEEDVRLTKEKLKESIDLIKKEEAFNYFYQQVVYVKEDRANRSIMDTLGWKKILQDEQVDIILIICLLLINIPLFTIEDDNEMRTLLIATRKGKRRIFLYKCFAGATLSLLCILFFTGMSDLSYFMNYELSGGTYTMQSIPTFQEAPFTISCSSALLLSRGIRIIGYMTLVMCIWLLSILIKKFAVIFSIACTSIFLLYVSIPVPYIYYIPNPIALILSSGYFRGKENIILNKGTEFEFIIASYQDTNKAIQFLNIVALLLILSFLLIKAYRLYSNIRSSKKTKHIAILSLLVLCMLSGCNIQTTNKTILPNSNISEESTSYAEPLIKLKDNELFIMNSDGLQRLIQDPMYQTNNDEVMKGFSVAKECVYFLKTIRNSYTKGSTIFKYDIENRSVEPLYSNIQNFEEEKLFGLRKTYAIDLEDAPKFDDILKFFVHNEMLYLVNDNGNITVQSTEGNTAEVIVDDYYACLSLVNDELYYITENLDIRAYN